MKSIRLLSVVFGFVFATTPRLRGAEEANTQKSPAPDKPVKVAILLYDEVEVLDVAGPLEVFTGTSIRKDGKFRDGFETYLVAEELRPVKASGTGPLFVPQYTFETAPEPQILIVPGGDTSAAVKNPRLIEWIQKLSGRSELTASVCTGAFLLAQSGLLNGKTATTHRFEIKRLAKEFPDVSVKADVRFVESERLMTSAGVSAGIDMSLRIVEHYFGREVATQTVQLMEYEGTGWVR